MKRKLFSMIMAVSLTVAILPSKMSAPEADVVLEETAPTILYNGEPMARRTIPSHVDPICIKSIAEDSNVGPGLIDGGEYYITNYCACSICCGPYATCTCADGTHVSTAPLDHSAAADPSIPFGTRFMIPELTGFTIYTVHDRGSAVNGRHFDLYQETHDAAANAPCGYYRVIFLDN